MKTRTAIACAALLAAISLPAADIAKPACCLSGGAEEKPGPPLRARSLYQLDSPWTDDAGGTVRLASFRGRPVVMAMFFAQCEYACPVLVSDMQRLRNSLPADVRDRGRFILITFDTERDTPAALKGYRERAALDAGWTLLHGDAAAVQELAMLLGVKYKKDARGQFSHSNLITVLNPEGEIAHQKQGLKGDVSEAARAVALASR